MSEHDFLDEEVNKSHHDRQLTETDTEVVSASEEDLVTELIVNRKQKRVWRLPWFILINSSVQICLHMWANVSIYQHLIFVPALSMQFWRFLSYTLLHSDTTQLLLNICLQSFLGIILECEQGHWRVALIYTAGGASGSLATLLLQPHLSLLGASAAVYSLLMSHIPHLMMNFSLLTLRYFRLVALAVLWLSDAASTAYHFQVNHNTNPRICLVAHVGGGVAGLLLGFVVYAGAGATRSNCCRSNAEQREAVAAANVCAESTKMYVTRRE